MTVMMIQSRIKPECVAEVEAAARTMFAAIDEAQPDGVRYASSKLPDGETFVVLLQLEDGVDGNPLAQIPEFGAFQARLNDWTAGPPIFHPLEIVGSFRLFAA
jgi:hypothetical protein